jgi:SAM-dependent methyltransferase
MEPIKIDIGCGTKLADGWTPWDIHDGHDARELVGIADGSVDAIKASHVLEHIPYRETIATLREWARALRVGGELFLAVPDFDKIVASYVNGDGSNIEGYLLGGQTDAYDRHLAIFNRGKLDAALAECGFDVVGTWPGDIGSCSALPVSLNVRAVKRSGGRRFQVVPMPDVHAVMSMPRLAWTENMNACFSAFGPLGIPFVRATGVFWGQCLQRLWSDIVRGGKHKYVLAVDYDTIFDAHDVTALRYIADTYELDAVCPLQIGRDRGEILARIDDGTGNPVRELPIARLAEPHWPCLHGHFGLTLIRCESLAKLPMPWFIGLPGANGEWGLDRVDDDVYFWKHAAAAGWRISTTPQVRVGHLQMVATWPGADLECVHQFMPDYHLKGRPSWMHPLPPSS